jgi:hypothetical protein
MTGLPATTSLTTGATTITTIDHARQMRVCNTLAHDLDKLLRNYRTFDRKPLTEGEVIVALGFLVGKYVKDPTRVTTWMQQIAIASHDAALGEKK